MSLSSLRKQFDVRIERIRADTDVLGRFLSSIERQFDDRVDVGYMSAVEWILRHYQAGKHILGAALLFGQTTHLAGTALANLASYTAYYSIYHALCSVFVLFPHKTFNDVVRISHATGRNWLQEELIRRKVLPAESLGAFDAALMAREGFSYRVPLSSNPGGKEAGQFLNKAVSSMELLVPALAQLANLLSHGTHEAAMRKFGEEIKDEYEIHQEDVDQLFFGVLQISGRPDFGFLIDDDDYRRAGYFIRKRRIAPLSWFVEDKLLEDLEGGWWEQADDADFDVAEVQQLITRWIEP